MKRTDLLWILAAALVWSAVFLAAERAVNGSAFAGLPVDDAWIHARFAHTFAEGHPLVFTGTQPVPGETSPLWAALIGALFALFGERDPALLMRLASGVAYVTLGIATGGLAWRVTRRRADAVTAAITTVSIGEVVWMGQSGMEAALFSLLLVLATAAHLEDRHRMSIRTGALFGLAAAVRPETLAFFGLALVHRLVLPGDVRWRTRLTRVAPGVIAFALLGLPYFAFCRAATGHLFPNTFYAKRGDVDVGSFWRYLYYYYGILFVVNPVLWITALLGTIAVAGNRARRPADVYLGVPVLLFGIVGGIAGGQSTARYFYPYIPFVVVLAVIGLRAIAGSPLGPRRGRRLAGTLGALAALVIVGDNLVAHLPPQHLPHGGYASAKHFAWNVRNINEQQVQAAGWVRQNVPPGEVVATNDIGAIAYFGGHPVYDLCGLVSNDVMEIIRRDYPTDSVLYAHVRDRIRPRYLALYTRWYPDWPRWMAVDTAFPLIAAPNTICGSDTMTLFRVRWPEAHAR